MNAKDKPTLKIYLYAAYAGQSIQGYFDPARVPQIIKFFVGNLESVETVEDGFGGVWSAWCHKCKQQTIQVVRPGKVQCVNCG